MKKEFYKTMTEEELECFMDELHRPKKMNTRRTLAPLFVYLFLTENENKRFSQKELQDALLRAPYEIEIERKALSRTIHLLKDAGIGIHSYAGLGTWFGDDDESIQALEDYYINDLGA